MGDRVPLPSIAGLLSGFMAVDLFAGHFAEPARIVGFQPAVTDAPSGGSVSVDLRTATGGGGSGLSATIADGDTFPTTPVTGSIEVAGGTDLYLRITDASGSAMNLYGNFEVAAAAGAVTALTTLSLVKDYCNVAGTDDDAMLNRIISAVSLKMQNYMRRAIVEESITGEKHGDGSLGFALELARYPFDESSVAITLDGTVLDATDYDADESAGLVYYTPSDGDPVLWPAGRRNVSITYDSGFASVPADIEHAATVQAAWEFKRTRRLGDRTSVVGDNTATFLIDAWAPDVVPVLDMYRRRSI